MNILNDSHSAIAIIGGGRWGHVTLTELSTLELPFQHIVSVSQHNAGSIQELAEKLQPNTGCKINHASSIEELFKNYQVKAAIIVNNASQHFATAMSLLEHSVNLLIEKPVVLNIKDARTLLDKAKQQGVCVVPGLSYSYLSYLENFASSVAKTNKDISHFSLDWADPAGIHRYYQNIQTFDKKSTFAEDVMSHVWAILNTVFHETHFSIEDCEIKREGKYSEYTLSLKHFTGHIKLEKDATERRRKMEVHFTDGSSCRIEFTAEPGIIYSEENSISGDPNWANSKRPLVREYEYFLQACNNGVTSLKDDIAFMESVELTETALEWMQEQMENL